MECAGELGREDVAKRWCSVITTKLVSSASCTDWFKSDEALVGVFRNELLSLRIIPPPFPLLLLCLLSDLFPPTGRASPISASTAASPLIDFSGMAAPGGVGGVCKEVGVLLPRRPIRFHSDERCVDDVPVVSLGGFEI